MKLYKKALLLVMSLVVSGGYGMTMASEVNNQSVLQMPQEDIYKTTDSGIIISKVIPEVEDVNIEDIDGDTYLMIRIHDKSGVDWVTVDDEYADFYSGNKYDCVYAYEITEGGDYDIYIRNEVGNSKSISRTVKFKDKKPELELSQTTKNGRYYLVIKASDDGEIERVTVNGERISFDEDGETRNYEVDESGYYTVVVIDDAGNETRDRYYIDIDASKPDLELDKEYKNNEWYLIIKASPTNNNRLSKVTVNNKSISFNSRGDEVSYQVSSTDTYKVVVTDDLGMQRTESIYINVRDQVDNERPTLNLSESIIGSSKYYLVIKFDDNEKVTKIRVNGESLAVPDKEKTILYEVTPGRYTVWASDAAGNETQQSIQIISNEPDYSVTGTQTVKFRLYHKDWTINGSEQPQMDTPPLNRNGRIYLPLRFTAYALGIDSSQITWDGRSQSAIIYDGYDVIKVTLGARTMLVNGKSVAMDSPAIIENNRVLLPISQVSKAFVSKGISLNWDNIAKEITITRVQ